jgi:small multidrug resistance pump
VNRWLILGAAIVTEVAGTLSLRGAQDHAWLYAVTVVGEVTSFFLLIRLLRDGFPLGALYGIWSALGVALTAVWSSLLFDEAFTGPMVIGLVLIVGGVVLVENGAHAPAEGGT